MSDSCPHCRAVYGASLPLSFRIHAFLCGGMLRLMGVSCRDFNRLESERNWRPLTRSERLRYRTHSALCGLCRPIPKQNERLLALARDACSCEADSHLSPEAKARISASLKAEK